MNKEKVKNLKSEAKKILKEKRLKKAKKIFKAILDGGKTSSKRAFEFIDIGDCSPEKVGSKPHFFSQEGELKIQPEPAPRGEAELEEPKWKKEARRRFEEAKWFRIQSLWDL